MFCPGVASWVLVLPFDVIKSKIIADSLTEPLYQNTWDCVKKTYWEGGLARFFQGFWLVCLRAFPVNGITFVVYEMLMDKCNEKLHQIETNKLEKPVKSKWS